MSEPEARLMTFAEREEMERLTNKLDAEIDAAIARLKRRGGRPPKDWPRQLAKDLSKFTD
jgi:hypothetical protein